MTLRQRKYLANRYRAVFGYVAFIWICIGIILMLPLVLIPFWDIDSRTILSLLLPGSGLVVMGAGVWRAWRPRESFAMTQQEGAVTILMAWLTAVLVGLLPFMIAENLTFSQAFFESMSGWTTTGLSVIDVEQAHPIILFYRSLIQFAGGAGFAIIMLTLISNLAGTGFSSAEGRSDQLVPNVRQSAVLVLRLYVAYALFGTLALWLVGMSFFDAVNHAFAALSTGGFSTRADSIGYWDSAQIEFVIGVLMLLGTTNFLIAYAVLQGRWRALTRSTEMRALLTLFLLGTLILFWGVTQELYPIQKALRVALFETLSALSTSGFSTVGYSSWRMVGWFALTLLMLIGGGTGSTAGGIKLSRFMITLKSLRASIKRGMVSERVVNKPVYWEGDRRIDLSDSDMHRFTLYVVLHLGTLLLGTFILVAHDYDIGASLFEMMSSISTIGLSVGITSPNAPQAVLYVMSAGMLLGRLEYFAVFIALSKLLKDSSDFIGWSKTRT